MYPRPRTLPARFIAPCLPIKAPRPPSGELWLHEIKHDGFRVIARKDGDRVRLYKGSPNWVGQRCKSNIARARDGASNAAWLPAVGPGNVGAGERPTEPSGWGLIVP